MKKMTIALVRVSNDNMQDTQSQELAINEFCKKKGYVINKWFREEGVSGSKIKLQDRVILQEIRDLCLQEDKVERMVVFNSDRIGRRMEMVAFVSLLDECGVEIVSVTEGILNGGLDTDSLITSIKFWMAQNEAKKIGERVRNGKKANWKDDVYVGGKLSLGYKVEDKKVVIDETYVSIIKNIFDLYIKYGTKKCIEYLDNLGIKNLNGKPYTRQGIVGIIKNRNYLGYRSSEIYDEEFHVPSLRIIDDYTFKKANEILKSRTVKKNKTVFTNRNNENKYESLLYHKCYDGSINKLHLSYTYAKGKKYHTVVCDYCKSYRYPIKKTYATKKLFKKLDIAIEEKLSSLSSDKIEYELRQRKGCVIRDLEAEIQICEEDLKEEKQLLEGLNKTLDDIFKGKLKFDLQQILDRVSATQSRIVEKEKKIKQLSNTLQLEKDKSENKYKLLDKFRNFKNIYDLGTDEQKKIVLRELVDNILIDEKDNIVITLKYVED